MTAVIKTILQDKSWLSCRKNSAITIMCDCSSVDKPRKMMAKPFHPIMLQRQKLMLSPKTGCKNTQTAHYNYFFWAEKSV